MKAASVASNSNEQQMSMKCALISGLANLNRVSLNNNYTCDRNERTRDDRARNATQRNATQLNLQLVQLKFNSITYTVRIT